MTLFSATLISKDRKSNLMHRLYTTPMTPSDFIFGYTLPLLPIAVAEGGVCYLFAILLRLEISINILLSILLIIPIALFYIGVGLLCGSVFNDKQVGGICGALMTNLSAWLSGIWFDLELVGGAFKKIAYALFGVAGAAGFVAMYLFVPNYLVAAAVGVVVAMAAMYFVRWAFVIITSCAAGAVLMAIISAMAPNVGILQLSGIVGKVLAILAALIFVSVQITATKKEGTKKIGGTRRVKIRRVFDAW
jgi:hypothetical protein